MEKKLLNEISRISEIINYIEPSNKSIQTINEEILNEAGIAELAKTLASAFTDKVRDEIGILLKRTIQNVDDLTEEDFKKILKKDTTHIAAYKDVLFSEIQRTMNLTKGEAKQMTLAQLQKRFKNAGYNATIAGQFGKWYQTKYNIKFKDVTPSPNPAPNPAPNPTPTPSAPNFTSQEDAWEWFKSEFKTYKIFKKLGPQQGKFFVDQMKKTISDALESPNGQKFIVDLTNMKTLFDKLPPIEKQKLLKETQTAIYNSKLGKGLGKRVTDYLWTNIREFFTSIQPTDASAKKVKVGIITFCTIGSLVTDILQMYESTDDAPFEGHFDLDFPTIVAGKFAVTAVLGYYGKLAALTVLNMAIFADSQWNYWKNWNARRNYGDVGFTDFGRKLSIEDAKKYVMGAGNPIDLDNDDKGRVTYELVDKNNKPMLKQGNSDEGRYVNVYTNGEYYAKIGVNYLQQPYEVKKK